MEVLPARSVAGRRPTRSTSQGPIPAVAGMVINVPEGLFPALPTHHMAPMHSKAAIPDEFSLDLPRR